MGENSNIQWTDHTFNPWIGCQRVSPGCVNCYAENETYVRVQRSAGRELWGPKGERHVTSEANWRKPLAWNRAAEKRGTPAKVFCASLADVFEDRPELVAPRTRLFLLIQNTPWLRWQLLTKRPENVLPLVPEDWQEDFPSNVWMGTTVEDQQRADERIPHLLQVPASVRFLSCEPLLGPVDLRPFDWLLPRNPDPFPLDGRYRIPAISWVIVGGESGPDARPFDLQWARVVVRRCQDAGVAVFVKQLGARPFSAVDRITYPGNPCNPQGFSRFLNDRKGGDWSEWPDDLLVREFPEVSHAG